ncbi:hypothetical protein AN644_02365 [Candidatus Epulonipiscium fishelsonii]|nr:hypothetical protein AN644_02365 [Epulopiscium sp. SCG-C06WGA-EpuloA1]
MKIIPRFITSLLIITLVLNPTIARQIVGYVPDKPMPAAQMYADFLIENAGVQNIQYALIRDGKFIVSGASGINSRVNHNDISTTHMYPIGSVSKMFTAVAIMNLVEEGKLELNAPIVTYLPEFKMADDRYKNITVRMLINHSSGFMGNDSEDALLFNDNDTINHDTLLERLSTQRLKANPGEFSVYCNTGFAVAELLIEKVSGMTFTDYIHT